MKLKLHTKEHPDMLVLYIEDDIKQFEMKILYSNAGVYSLENCELTLGELKDLVERSRKMFIKHLIDRESENFFS